MPHARLARYATIGLVALLAGCSHPSYYGDAERRFTTGGVFSSQGHLALYYSSSIHLDFPGYIVGVEVSDRSNLLRDGDLVVEPPAHAGRTITRLADRLRDGTGAAGQPHDPDELPFISHVIRYTGEPGNDGGACALHSVYQSPSPELVPFCGGEQRPRIDEWESYRSGFQDSWLAIDALKQAVGADVRSGHFTHLIVITLGWRTPQEEAVRSFNSIAHAIRKSADGTFRPLLIGVTWVGPWAGRWLDPLVEILSYNEIAFLADTLGLTWLGVVAEEVMMPLSGTLPTVYISHSFGTRAAMTGVCVGPAIRRSTAGNRPGGTGAVGRVIGLEGAFSLERFHEEPPNIIYEDIYYPNHCERARSIVLTASANDRATPAVVWADFAGNHAYLEPFCSKHSDSFVSCASVDDVGNIQGEYDPTRKVLYLDATSLIRYGVPGTDGGAHSDIFRPPMGRLLWQLIADTPR